MRSRVAIVSAVALLLVVAYVRAQQFGNQSAKLLTLPEHQCKGPSFS